MGQVNRLLWVAVFIAAGCGSAVKGDGRGGAGAVKIAGGGGGEPATPGTYDAPAQKFTPRQHGPHGRATWAGPGDLRALPPVKYDFGRCYGAKADEEAQIAAPVTPPYGGNAPAKPKDKGGHKKAEAAKPASSHAGTGAGYGGGGGGSGGYASAAPSAKAPSAQSASRADDMLAGASAPAGGGVAPSQPSYAPPPPAADMAPSAPEAEQKLAGGDSNEIAADRDEAPQNEYEDWGASIYLSNDDSMSLSSAQRVMYAIDNFLPLPLEQIRPHELLNYFSFETQEVPAGDDFSVLADIAQDPRTAGIYSLALAVRGRPVTKETRRNAAITWVVDRSGSMTDEGRMEYLKRGLARSLSELKDGDIVNMVLFDHTLCTPVEGFVVGRDDMRKLERAVDEIEPLGATDLHAGLTRGYELADRSYTPDRSNRVVLITDALANTGVTDEAMIATVSKYYDQRRIRLSGVGVGREFNDALLDKLTERGKGAYVFLGSEAEVDAVFGPRLISLIETTALDVHFLLHLPQSLRMNVFYGEESSTVKEDVQAIHYFANTSQLFLSDLMARGGELRGQDDVMLSIEYEDPETGDDQVEEVAFNLGEIEGTAYNVRKARLAMAWIDMLAQMAARPTPAVYRSYEGAWQDPEGWQACEDGRAELGRLGEGLESDPESRRILQLWDKFCSRFERPRNPVKRQIAAPESAWPGAQPTESR
jgi:Ca-activated chloride channel homolog